MKQRYSIVSIAIILICVVIAVISKLGNSIDALTPLFIASPGSEGLNDVMGGQVWRLVTPMFIHFGIMHLVFNLMWVWDLGRLIEDKKGAGFYLAFVLSVGMLSNLVQYFFTGSPYFGGMSGALYGMFGYIWIQGRHNPRFAYDLRKDTIVMMLAWFVLCWTGLLGPIANWAHTTGLVVGVVWAYLSNTVNTNAHIGAKQGILAGDQLPHKYSLQYLSTADILKIEAQRQWVREHYLPEARHKYDSVEGKLAIIDAIVGQQHGVKFSTDEIQSLEITFGDALVQATGMEWATLEDRSGRTPVLLTPESPPRLWPVNTVSQWLARGQTASIQAVFEEAVRLVKSGSTA
ncbi:rhomboid family intramembrane serine protease [Undibacterium sp. SXout11W]|uniref:rhomboid family intramembrane serine protease n=1 Tax=Undibacterium sp. SXout11W TaxID=3413050 RepID=UPI003BF43E6E